MRAVQRVFGVECMLILAQQLWEKVHPLKHFALCQSRLQRGVEELHDFPRDIEDWNHWVHERTQLLCLHNCLQRFDVNSHIDFDSLLTVKIGTQVLVGASDLDSGVFAPLHGLQQPFAAVDLPKDEDDSCPLWDGSHYILKVPFRIKIALVP